MALVPSQDIDLDGTIGAAFIGTMVSLTLFGITSLQSYYYFQTYPKDGKGLKTLVLIVWLLDVAHSALICQAMYYYLVSNYNNPEALAIGTNTLWTSMLANLITSVIVQCFFTRRIFILASPKIRWPLAAFIGILALLHVIFGLITIVEIFEKKAFRRINELTNVAAPFAAFAVLADFGIAISLCVLLHNRRTGFRSTSNIISTLIIYAINRCLLTSVAATVEIIVLEVLPKTFWFLAVDFIFGKLYANSLLAMLNTRRSLRGTDRSTSDDIEMSGLQWGTPSSAPALTTTQASVPLSLDTALSDQRTQTVRISSSQSIKRERKYESPYVFEGEEPEEDERKVESRLAPLPGP